MNNFKVSIIIPAFNAGKYISSTLDSVINQTYKNIEIIIINDGSTDDTETIVHSYIKKDNRVIYYYQENKGCSASKNKGLELVNGEFVQYLDADDILSKDKIQKQVRALSENNNCIAVCKTFIFKLNINDTNEEIDTDLISKEGSGKDFLLRLWGSDGRIGMVQPNAYLVPINIINKIGKWDETLSPSPDEDGEYFARVLIASDKVIFTQGVNYYRKLANEWSLSKAFSLNHAIGLFKTIKVKFEPLISYEDNDLIKKFYAIQLTSCAYQFGNQYPEIFILVEEEFKKYCIKKYKVIKNTKFSIIANIIGFKNAMKIRKLIGTTKKLIF